MDQQFICPRCRNPLAVLSEAEHHCHTDSLTFRQINHIWRFLLPERQQYFETFMAEYQTVREAEDRFSDDPAYFQALPFEDLSQRRTADWRIRERSYHTLVENVIRPHEQAGHALRIVDMGAGNCWLSYRLAERGHQLAAVDLLDNDWDGLGSYRHYPVQFSLVQAEFDRLPFPDQSYDLIIFNASLHYSENYTRTLQEGLRCLRETGRVVIIDSPLYSNPESGRQMVLEREHHFEASYGFKSDALQSENFLTYTRLDEFERELSIRWSRFRPYYGFKWSVRPLLAAIRHHRQPAQFEVLVAERA